MDNEKANGCTKKAHRIAFILIAVIIGLAVLCIDRHNMLRAYQYDSYDEARNFCQRRGEYLWRYGSAIFPKYEYNFQNGEQLEEKKLYSYVFQHRMKPENTLAFSLPLFEHYQTMDEKVPEGMDTSDIGIDFTKLGVLERDLQQQQNMPEFEDETEYMLTASLGKEIPPSENQGASWISNVKLDDFREDMYYDVRILSEVGPEYMEEDKYKPNGLLDIWYGLAFVNYGNNYMESRIICGIDEETAEGCVSAEQMAVDYFRFMNDKIEYFHPTNSMNLDEAVGSAEDSGNYVRCLLLTGSGENIKEFITYAKAAGYIVEPLQVLDSI